MGNYGVIDEITGLVAAFGVSYKDALRMDDDLSLMWQLSQIEQSGFVDRFRKQMEKSK